MTARSLAVAALGALLGLATVGPAAAGSCDRPSAGNNPAFAEPRSCPPTAVRPSVVKPAGKVATRPGEVRRENGRTIYTDGDTTIAIGGSVMVDTVVGHGRMRR